MRKLMICLVFAAIAGCSASPAPDHPAAVDETAIVDGVTSLVNDWTNAGKEGRWEDLKSLYADEAGFTWIERGAVAYADHAAIVAGVDQASQMSADIASSVGNIRVTPLAPDAAAVVADIKLDVSFGDFGYNFDGVLSGVAVKRDGAWRFLQGHLSEPPKQQPPAE